MLHHEVDTTNGEHLSTPRTGPSGPHQAEKLSGMKQTDGFLFELLHHRKYNFTRISCFAVPSTVAISLVTRTASLTLLLLLMFLFYKNARHAKEES